MSQLASNSRSLKLVVAQEVHEADADEGLAEIGANRVIIEQAKGMLMVIYELDADNALEMLKWGARARDVEVGFLARQLAEGLAGRPRDLEGMDLRSACDDLLFATPERGRPVDRSGPQP